MQYFPLPSPSCVSNSVLPLSFPFLSNLSSTHSLLPSLLPPTPSFPSLSLPLSPSLSSLPLLSPSLPPLPPSPLSLSLSPPPSPPSPLSFLPPPSLPSLLSLDLPSSHYLLAIIMSLIKYQEVSQLSNISVEWNIIIVMCTIMLWSSVRYS